MLFGENQYLAIAAHNITEILKTAIDYFFSGCAATRNWRLPSLPRGETCAAISLTGPGFCATHCVKSSYSGLTTGTVICWYLTSAGSLWTAMFITGDKVLTEPSVAVTLSGRTRSCTTPTVVEHQSSGNLSRLNSSRKWWPWILSGVGIISQSELFFNYFPHRWGSSLWSLLYQKQTFQCWRVSAPP